MAQYLLITGGYNAKLGRQTEAAYLAEYANRLGIRSEQIILEDRATNTYENAVYAAQVCQQRGLFIQSAMLLCKNYHARRVLETFETYFSQDVSFLVCPYQDELGLSRESILENKSHQAILYGELEKIGRYHRPNQERKNESLSHYQR